MNRIAFAALSTSSLLFATVASAQSVLYDLSGSAAGDRFSHSVAGIGDVDGDLVPDWAVGAPFGDQNGSLSGAVHIFSGASGTELTKFLGNSPGDLFGYSVAGADLDGDGLSEIVVGAHTDDANGADSGTVYVYSGFDFSLLYSTSGTNNGDNFGFALDVVPDVDGDGLADLLVGAWIADTATANSGQAYLLKGSDGSLLHTFDGEQAFDYFGKAVAGLDDVNGDGFGDVLIGAPGNSANGSGAGAAYVYSGANGALLNTYRGQAAGDAFGTSLAAAGDLNGDSAGDYLVGAPGSDTAAPNAGMAQVLSGSRGGVLFNFYGLAAGDNFGSAVAAGADYTNDGTPDLLIGAPAADPNGASSGQLFIVSGSDGSAINTLDGSSAGARLGASLADAGDANGDGLAEILVGAWGEDAGPGAFAGVLHVLTFAQTPSLVSNYCSNSANSQGGLARIAALGTTSIADANFVLEVQDAVSNVPGLFFYGPNEVQTPFGDGFLCVGGQISRLPTTLTDGSGRATLALDLTNQSGGNQLILAGSTWKFQFWHRDPQGVNAAFNLSDGLSATFVQ